MVVYKTPAMLTFFSELFGPYPFDLYGVVVHTHQPYGLETQTLSLISRDALSQNSEGVIVHEEEASGDDLDAFFNVWLYTETLPPLPSVE